MIVDEDIGRVRDTLNLRDIVQQYVQLKRVGRQWAGLCPFHAEKSGSFYVNEEKGVWRCHGCGMGGDAISFVREIEHLDFVGAVEWLATKLGIGLRYTEQGEDESRRKRSQLVDAMRKAVAWYHDRLLSAPDAGAARGYLRNRGLDGDVVRQYSLGWAPESWDALMRSVRMPEDVAVDAGLGFRNRMGRMTDAFRGRLLFPIFDTNGDPVAFGGRILPGAEGPKYKNSSESRIYEKSKVLYGLNWAKTSIVQADQVVVCEGYTDVIGLASVGVTQAVATCGTALTEEHLRLLKKFAKRVVLSFDADAAGQNAAARFYEWEKRLDLEVAVAALPPGVDPGDLARSDPDRLRAAVDEAVEFLGFRVGRVLDAANLGSPEGRARAADAALAVIAEHPDDLVRDQYVMQVADRARIDAEQLRARMRQPGAIRVREVAAPRLPPRSDGPELEVLRHLIHNPAAVDPYLMVDPAASELLFVDGRNLAAFRALATTSSLQEALATADPGAAELLLRLAVEDADSDPEDALAGVVREATRRAVAEEEHIIRAQGLARSLAEPRTLAEALYNSDAASRRAAIERLLSWLGSRSEERA